MEETTKNFVRYPPITGVSFSGNDEIIIESRSEIEKEIKDFINYCRDNAEGVAARFILGEWGEGKTDTYERLIKPEITSSSDYLFFLSASRLKNSYENESVMNFAKFSLFEPDRLLTHLFNVIKASPETKDLIPEMKTNPKSFLNNSLESLLKNNNKRIFIFIDEFEELLLYPKTLQKVISGIKEAINGDFEVESLAENGKYKARLHFFVSCTPDAYYKIQVTHDFIMPGFDRRVGKIRLTQITKEEGLKYLVGLLKYSYTSNEKIELPQKLPISNLSVFNTLLRVSQRNMGNLTSLFTEIFKSLVNNDKLEILNYSKMLNLLKKHEITAYGGQTPCIDNNFDRIIKYLNETSRTNDGKECKEIFQLLIGELRPILINEISKTVYKDEDHVEKLVNTINNEIKENDKIERSIIKVAPLEGDKNIDDLVYLLTEQEYIKDHKTFNIPSIKFSEPIEKFKERIIFYDLNEDAELIPKVFLPINKEDTKAIFDDLIDNDGASELNKIFTKIISNEVAYLANESILNLIYPTPIPLDTAYFSNEEEKLKLWRYLSHNLNDEYEKNILEAFYIFMSESEVFKLDKNNSNIKLIDPETNSKINIKLLLVNGDVKVQDITKANEMLNKDFATNLVLILHNGEFSQEAYEALSIKSLGPEDKYQIMGIQLHHSIAKKILFGYKSLTEYKEYIDEDLFKGVCREKIEELNLKGKIKEWLEYQEKEGLVINQIKLKNSPNAKTFADGLKLYLNYDGSHSPEEIYNLNMNGILLYKKYGGKGFIASDFEDGPNEITKVSFDLKENGFLGENDGKYYVTTNPVENKIYEFINNKGGTVSLKDLKSYFIIRDRNDRAFQDVFVNILKYKGIIKQSGKSDPILKISNVEEAIEDLTNSFEVYKNNVNNDNFKRFGHYYVRKLRASKLILFEEFDSFLTTTYKEANSSNDLLKINICSKILENFNKNFLISINAAAISAPTIINDIDDIKSDLDDSLGNIIKKSVLWIKFDLNKNDIVEYKGLLEDFDEINELYMKKFSKDELLIEIEKLESKFKREYPDEYKQKLLEIFGFSKDNDTKPYYNIKIYLLDQKKNKFTLKASEIRQNLDKIDSKFDLIGDRKIELEGRLEKIKKTVSKENKLAFYMYKQLETANISPDTSVKSAAGTIDLISLLKSSEESLKIIGDRTGLVIKFTDLIEKINIAEINFLSNLNGKKEDHLIYKKICDTKNFDEDVKKLKDEINELQNKYDEIDMEELRKDIDKRKRLISILKEWSDLLEIRSEAISLEWEKYQNDNRKSMDKIIKTLDILETKEDINKDKISYIMYGIQKFKQNTKVKLLESEHTATELESIKENLNQQALSLIGDYLTENERELLLNLESMKSKWITYDNIQSMAYDNLEMDKKSLENSLDGLVKKGYIQRGLFLTI